MNTNEEYLNESSTASQNAVIASQLKKGMKITPIDALNLCGCFRLSARIHDLRHKWGMNIVREMIVTPSGKRVAQYKMAV